VRSRRAHHRRPISAGRGLVLTVRVISPRHDPGQWTRPAPSSRHGPAPIMSRVPPI